MQCLFAGEPFPPEGYNPEAPAMTPRVRQPFWAGPPPPGVPPGAFPVPMGPMTVPPPQRQRDLVSVPTLVEEGEDKGLWKKIGWLVHSVIAPSLAPLLSQ